MWGAILYDLHDKIYMNHDEDIHTFKKYGRQNVKQNLNQHLFQMHGRVIFELIIGNLICNHFHFVIFYHLTLFCNLVLQIFWGGPIYFLQCVWCFKIVGDWFSIIVLSQPKCRNKHWVILWCFKVLVYFYIKGLRGCWIGCWCGD